MSRPLALALLLAAAGAVRARPTLPAARWYRGNTHAHTRDPDDAHELTTPWNRHAARR